MSSRKCEFNQLFSEIGKVTLLYPGSKNTQKLYEVQLQYKISNSPNLYT